MKKKQKHRQQKIIIVDLEKAFTDLEMLFMAAALSMYGFEVVMLGHSIVPSEWLPVVKNAKAQGIIVCIHSVGKHINHVNQLAAHLELPIFVRTRAPEKAAPLLNKKITLLPENYRLLLAEINHSFTVKPCSIE